MRPEPLTAGCARGYNVATAGSSLKTKLIAIDDSGGIRIPAALLEQAGLRDKVEITIGEAGLVLRNVGYRPRAGWAEQIAAATEEDLALMVDDFVPTEFDEREWLWE